MEADSIHKINRIHTKLDKMLKMTCLPHAYASY